MYPHWFGIRIDDPRMYPMYEKCAELDVPISFQTGQGTMRSNSRIVARPIWIDNIARDFPSLKIVALHSGYPWEEELVALTINNDNIFICPDVPPPRMWHGAILEYLKEEGRFEGLNGSDKIVWATDWPLQDQEASLKEIDNLGLAPSIRRKLVRDNAIRIFNLESHFQKTAAPGHLKKPGVPHETRVQALVRSLINLFGCFLRVCGRIRNSSPDGHTQPTVSHQLRSCWPFHDGLHHDSDLW